MKLAFCLSSYHPFSGMSRDFLHIAQACAQQQHEIHVFTRSWEGDIPTWLFPPHALHVLPNACRTNHHSMLTFAQDCKNKIAAFAMQFDHIIGFSKIPGLDFYYAADTCFMAKPCYKKFSPLRLSARYKIYTSLERSIFSPQSNTKILAISEQTMQHYIACYHTPRERFYLLPPNVARDRRPTAQQDLIRTTIRRELEIPETHFLILSIGSSYRTKGVDRSLHAFAALPPQLKQKSHFVIVGQEKNIKKYRRMAEKLHINATTLFLGPRNDIPELLAAADLLLHAARTEAAGIAIAEALVAYVPVLVTENCGYAPLVRHANAGKIIPVPFQQQHMNDLLTEILDEKLLKTYQEHARTYTATHDFHSMIDQAVALITQE